MNTEPTFGRWLKRVLWERDWSQAELSRRMEVAPITVSQWVRDLRLPTVASCYAIADTLDLPLAQVMQAAGYPADDEPNGDREKEDRVVALFRRLSPEGQDAVVQFVEFQRGRERRERES